MVVCRRTTNLAAVVYVNGLWSISCADGPPALYTDYVATRWYRAPELLVGDVRYDSKVDGKDLDKRSSPGTMHL